MDVQEKLKTVKELFEFFQLASPRLDQLINNTYQHFYNEYIGDRRALKSSEFGLLVSKSSYKQIALALNKQYNRSNEPDNKYSLVTEYKDELITLFSLNLWFNNFNYAELKPFFTKFPKFKKAFDSRIEQGAIKFVSGASMWEIFFNSNKDLQESFIELSLRHQEETIRSIEFSLDIYKKMPEFE